MKKAALWETDGHDVSSDDSSDSEDDGLGNIKKKKMGNTALNPKNDTINASSIKKRGGLDFNALSRHGYSGGPSVLKVPEPRLEQDRDWSWSKGKRESEDIEESFEERERTRVAVTGGDMLLNVQKRQPVETRQEKGTSFSQREKRKRDLGQASRGKSYVEEEKRLLRDSGVYSGFDS